MSLSSNGRILTAPHLRLNSGSQNPDVDDVVSESPFKASRLLITSSRSSPRIASHPLAVPLRPYSPYHTRSRSTSRPTTAEPQYYEGSSNHLAVPDARLLQESRSPSRHGSQDTSRRTSYSSDVRSRTFAYAPYIEASASSSDDGLNTQTVAERFAIVPDQNLIIQPDDLESDDYLHNPDPNEKVRRFELFSSRGYWNLCGLAALLIIIISVAIALPV